MPKIPMSVGIFVQFRRFRTAHFGDITKNKEHDLMCPINPIGQSTCSGPAPWTIVVNSQPSFTPSRRASA
jgi:hypothetical protein